ncbi:MAG: DUF3006 domain-containing protein [Oscillospiraceae bacterium]|jgi:hypothetical protein|nr:DUF3006 domain-containing protein [Oscillospiraceae bacterium]
MTLIVDRIEGGFAVCEDDGQNTVNLPLAELPEGAREGMYLRREGAAWVPDLRAEEAARERIREKMRRLRREP